LVTVVRKVVVNLSKVELLLNQLNQDNQALTDLEMLVVVLLRKVEAAAAVALVLVDNQQVEQTAVMVAQVKLIP
jgi:hypothetical protein